MAQTKAAKYRRISDDREGRELGVTRQDEDLDDLARRRGYEVVADYSDNDIGASTRSKKTRPGYQRMIADAKAGQFRVILAYTSSRLTRRPREHEDLIDLAEQHHVRFEYLRSPDFDLNTSAGRRVARILAATDAGEAEDTAERVTRARLQQARDGRFGGGSRPFGFEPDGVTVREDEAAEIREAADAVLAGVGLRGVVADWNARGVLTVRGGRWIAQTLRGLLLAPRMAGLVVYRGEILEGVAGWPAIIDPATWEAVRALLNSPDRRTTPGPTPKWLGSGIYRCGHPDHGDSDVTMRVGSSGNLHYPMYRCSGHMVRTAKPLDDYVQAVIVERLSRPDAAELLAARPDVNVTGLSREANELRARIIEAKDLWEDGVLTLADLKTRTARMASKLAHLEEQVTAGAGRSPLTGIAGHTDAAAIWAGLDLGRRRAVLDLLMTVTVLPRDRRGRGFDPDSVDITWKT